MKKSYLLLFSVFSISMAIGQNPVQTAIKKEKPINQSVKSITANSAKNVGQNHGIQNQNAVKGKGFGEHTCKTHELTKKYYEQQGIWDAFNQSYQESTSSISVPSSMKTPGVNTISVIFHVVYNPNNPAENVSSAAIMSVFNDIQEDFQLLNADAANARPSFGFVPADANINFCLATQTPSGVPLTEVGVIRVSTTEDWYDSNNGEENKMKAASTGGSDIWDRNKYLNVWICDISNGANSGTAGYAYRPTTTFLPSATIDGIVIDYNLGVNNDNVLTHEIGHYLGLDHTWGGSGGCSNDDGFADTPNTAGPSFNYSGSCSGNQTTCSGVQTQYENYMDYSNCTVMYTQSQANYMLSILSGIRNSLLLSPGCNPVNAPPVADFNADLSSPIIIPVGASVNFFDLSTNQPTSWSWNFGGGATNSVVQNPTATFNTVGTYTIALTATNSYGSDIESKTGYVQVVNAAAGTACDTLRNYNPVTESYAYYNITPAPNWGFFPGTGKISNGTIGINQYADKYTAPASTQVRRLRFPIAKAVNSSGNGLMKIRVQSDAAGSPGTILVTDTLLIADMDAGFYNEFDFTNPPTVTGNFWVTFEVFYGTPQDSVSLMCVDINDRVSGINTMKAYYSSVWHLPSDIFGATFKSSLWLDVLTSNGPAPSADFSYSEAEICAGGQITVNGSSSLNTTNYYWYITDDPFTTVLSQSSTAANNFTFPTAANRRIYLFADGSCKTDGIYLPVVIDPIPSATVTTTNTTCGNNNGTLVFSNPTGGDTPNYSYSLDGVNYQSSPIFNNLAPGTYIAHIKTPGDNCDRTYTKTITGSSELTATVSPGTTICNGNSTLLTAGGGSTYTWYDGTTVIGNSASITVMPIASSQYSCVVSDGTCQATVYSNVNVDQCGGLENNVALNVKIYPNPTTQNLTIELPGTFEYKMFDVQGRSVAFGKANDTVKINTESLDKGVYFIEVNNGSYGNSFKLIKQ